MGVTLSQSQDASFDDRPRHRTGHGLRATLTTGDTGQLVAHDLKPATGLLHIRMMLRVIRLDGGPAIICHGLDDQDQTALTLILSEDRNLQIETRGGASTSTPLPMGPSPAWVCLEIGIDALSGNLSLWANGILIHQASGIDNGLTIRRLEFGVPRKHAQTTGEIHFDEIAVGNAYLGPVRVEPSSDFADDPARWLVVYNRDDADSIAWADSYRRARGVPHANFLGLSLPTAETIGFTAYLQLLERIETYLDLNGLRHQVFGILLGYRVPGYANHPELDQRRPIGSLLHTDADHLFATTNPLATSSSLSRPNTANLVGIRLSARIDAPSLSQAAALTQRADELDQQPPGPDDRLWVDRIPATQTFAAVSERLASWFASLDRQRLRLESIVSDSTADTSAPGFSTIEKDAFYWGWNAAQPPAGFFSESRGPRAVCAQLRQPDVLATTLRSVVPTNWVEAAIDAGYAIAIGSSHSTSTSALPIAQRFFEALRRGWTVAEAWVVSQPFLRGGMYLVGDPLMTVRTPRNGWDVFGPLRRSED